MFEIYSAICNKHACCGLEPRLQDVVELFSYYWNTNCTAKFARSFPILTVLIRVLCWNFTKVAMLYG